jgi:hypothetical protein
LHAHLRRDRLNDVHTPTHTNQPTKSKPRTHLPPQNQQPLHHPFSGHIVFEAAKLPINEQGPFLRRFLEQQQAASAPRPLLLLGPPTTTHTTTTTTTTMAVVAVTMGAGPSVIMPSICFALKLALLGLLASWLMALALLAVAYRFCCLLGYKKNMVIMQVRQKQLTQRRVCACTVA